ncbi:MarR family transcriptional regulator [Saccharopolyspora hirsuta]|uniref:MarR family transcriptional regulator n=1 Tax=Saccharopolyspora hirsuta TaxID=1837 RepID=A0A5M7BHX0_SACHI|nr:MarR family transcriptional regulator [Saccharopolyspora hirsuta]KAA5828280.1 MarR family transcriptional regulator [Saccharopolyspora hirsuta]
MARAKTSSNPAIEDVDAVTDAVLTASRLLVAVSARSVAAVEDSLTLPQFRLLVVLSSAGPLKLAALAEALGVNPSTATRMIDRLIGTELVDRRPNPVSRRENVVALTPNGADVVAKVTARRRSEIARIVKRMPAAARRGLVGALAAFTEAGGEPPIVGPSYRPIAAQWG